ncbi:selenide, water dikinase SelD [Gaopeijia maritima]
MAELAQVLRPLIPSSDPQTLVDASTGDDAAVYLLDGGSDADRRAVVVSVDFFTPMVDDARDFGRIAATNALSDLYAMGARPLFALNLLGFPRKLLDSGLAEQMVAGAAEVAANAGIPILGGHSIDDPEPKFGMVVIGEAAPDRLVTNAGAQAGDRLVLTKPLGVGVITTALKNDATDAETIAGAVRSMTTLNDAACAAMLAVGVHAATDVTGFGLLGHLRSMMRASGTGAVLRASAVPLLAGARELALAGQMPGGSKRNLADLADELDWSAEIDPVTRLLLCDAQTSGGLLIAVEGEKLDLLLAELRHRGVEGAVIGTVRDDHHPGRIAVV